GSNVFTESDRAPDLCIITVGSFADPNFPAPTASIYEESMHSWFGLSTISHHFAQGSPRDARGFPIKHMIRAPGLWTSSDGAARAQLNVTDELACYCHSGCNRAHCGDRYGDWSGTLRLP